MGVKVDCKDDANCKSWVDANCKQGEVSEWYCRTDVGECHFTGSAPGPPPPTPPKTCKWESAVVPCSDYSECDDWVTSNCGPGQVASDYCKANGFCHFVGASVTVTEMTEQEMPWVQVSAAQMEGKSCNDYTTISSCTADLACAWSHFGCVSKK